MSDEAVRDLPLIELHRRLGGEVAERRGLWLPLSYAPVAEEVEVLHEACGLLDRCWIDRLEIAGPDRARFLNGMVTCEVRELGEGGGAYGFVTNRKGGVLSDIVVLELGDRYRLELPPGRGTAVADHLGRYVLADRVEISASDDPLPLTVAGPEAKRLLRALLGGALPSPTEVRWGHAPVQIAGRPARLSHRPLLGEDAWTVWVAEDDAPAVFEALLDAGARPVGFEALDTVRIEAGIPWWGRDFDDSNLPQETGLDEALNFTKGCYLGQEVVARIHYRGGVNRKLRGLQFDGDEPPAEGTELRLDGRPVGTVGSVAVSPVLEGPVGLALLHDRGAEPGTRLEVTGDGEAEVAELPLVS